MDRGYPDVRLGTHARALLAVAVLAQAVLAQAVLAQAPLAVAQVATRDCPNGVVERIEIQNGPVFPTDPENPRVVRLAFGAANGIHVNTTRSFIRRELLFAEGDCYDPFLVSESRRVLDAYHFVDQVRVETSEGQAGKIVRFRTQDRWSTQVDLGVTYDAGLNLERFSATETNFLGNGILAEVSHSERRERRDRHARLASPRVFGRTDGDLRFGTTSAGSSVYQRLNHGFVGDVSRWSWTESTERTTYFRSYATGGGAPQSHVLVPVLRDGAELAVAMRLGVPGRYWTLGLAFDRTVYRQNGPYKYVQDGDFDGAAPDTNVVPHPAILRQTVSRGATRVVFHAGLRQVRYVDYAGLDALSEVRIVPAGFEGSVSAGRSLGILVPDGVTEAGDAFLRPSLGFTKAADWGVLRIHGLAEAGFADATWRDLLGASDAALWVRARWLPAQTMFLRASAGGAWRTTLPFQLALGGRDGVRSLADDQHPGGRRVLFTIEDRVRFAWPPWSGVELGATVFADAGRVWPGDVPYGTDDGWMGSAGFGLRIVVPRGSSEILKPEIAFPVGRSGAPIFRITAELNSVRGWLSTPRLLESRRFWRGAEHF